MNVTELAWLVTSLVGLGLALYGIVQALLDRRAVSRIRPRNGRHLLATQQLIRYALRVLIFASWIGALGAVRASVELFAALMILANVALAAATASDLYVAAMLRRIYRPKTPGGQPQ